jgi:HTH-type transcriptional regulator, sugar sensing transcriptional regulator
MDRVRQVLLNLDLSDKEADVYLQLLQAGTSPASAVAQRTGMTRSTAHYTCQQLSKKGIVARTMKNTVFLFSAEPPEKLEYLIEQKRNELDRRRDALREVLPEMHDMLNEHPVLPRVRFFEGATDLMVAYKQIIDDIPEGGEILGYVYPLDPVHHGDEHYHIIETFKQNRLKKNISIRYIAAPSPMSEELQKDDERVKRQTRIGMDMHFKGQPVEILIYADKICCVSAEQSVLFAFMVQHTSITEMHKAAFELAWKHTVKGSVPSKE